MAKKRTQNTEKKNLTAVSKQTAGGVTGAVLGGIVGGPVGAVAGGVVGALVGNSSAKGNHPLKTAVDTIRSAGKRGAKVIKNVRSKASVSAKRAAAKDSPKKAAHVGNKHPKKPAAKKPVRNVTAKVAPKSKIKGSSKLSKKKT